MEKRPPSRRGRHPISALGVALAAGLAVLVAGCSTAPTPSQRLARYRPSVENANPSAWKSIDSPRPGTNGTFDPGVSTGARPLKRGDGVIISLRGIPNPEDVKDVVDDRGNVNLPLIGTLCLAGKTTSDAERTIEKTYIDKGYYSRINVTVVAQEDEYFVTGEVKRENRYVFTRNLTLMQAIAVAGGFTDFAKESAVRITRDDQVLEVDTQRVRKGRIADPLVKPGDIISVPRRWVW